MFQLPRKKSLVTIETYYISISGYDTTRVALQMRPIAIN